MCRWRACLRHGSNSHQKGSISMPERLTSQTYHPHRRNKYERNKNKKSQELGFPLCWIIFGKCGLLLWLVRAQHDHYESTCERNLGGTYLHFYYESENKKS